MSINSPTPSSAPALLAEVRMNHCNCHPETCCCNDYAVYVGDKKHSTHFRKEVAELVARALNANI
jgi:hypothetical protein